MGKAAKKIEQGPLAGLKPEMVREWFRITHLGRLIEDKAYLYIRAAKGWSYHAPFAGHDGIQLALGQAFRANKDFLFPYYRDLLTCLAAGLTVDEILLNGLSKDGDVAGGGRHMSNHFAKPEIGIQNVSSCTGNHTLHAVGVARAIKYYESMVSLTPVRERRVRAKVMYTRRSTVPVVKSYRLFLWYRTTALASRCP